MEQRRVNERGDSQRIVQVRDAEEGLARGCDDGRCEAILAAALVAGLLGRFEFRT